MQYKKDLGYEKAKIKNENFLVIDKIKMRFYIDAVLLLSIFLALAFSINLWFLMGLLLIGLLGKITYNQIKFIKDQEKKALEFIEIIEKSEVTKTNE